MSKGGGQPQQQSQSGDNSLDFVWMIAIIIIGASLGWYFGKGYIIPIIFKVRLWEIRFIYFIMDNIQFISLKLGFDFSHNAFVSLKDWQHFIYLHQGYESASQLSFSVIDELSSSICGYFNYPVLLEALILASILFFSHVASKFKTTYNMSSLAKKQKLQWPHIGVVTDKNLVDQPIDQLPWSMALQPLEFCRKYGLLKKVMKDGRPKFTIDRVLAHRIFALPSQMGSIWIDLNKLPTYVLALFAIFAAHGNKNVKGAKKLLRQIALSASTGKPNYSGARLLLMKHVKEPSVGRAVGMHGYIYTVMASMLVLARTGGVLACAEFLWLKAVDRGLWYMLSSVGRRTAFVEVSGVYGHWLVELRLRRPLKVPVVGEAVNALEYAIQEIKIDSE